MCCPSKAFGTLACFGQALFFSDFAAAFQKLEELGCKNLKAVNLA